MRILLAHKYHNLKGGAEVFYFEVARVLNRDKRDLEGARRLVDAPGMPERWVAKLRQRLGGTVDDESARTKGPTDA